MPDWPDPAPQQEPYDRDLHDLSDEELRTVIRNASAVLVQRRLTREA